AERCPACVDPDRANERSLRSKEMELWQAANPTCEPLLTSWEGGLKNGLFGNRGYARSGAPARDTKSRSSSASLMKMLPCLAVTIMKPPLGNFSMYQFMLGSSL